MSDDERTKYAQHRERIAASLRNPPFRQTCDFITEPALKNPCSLIAFWRVFYTVGVSRTPVEVPFLRCTNHLTPTILALSEPTHSPGNEALSRVERSAP